jgi:NADH-quinone oxidoreductase subunit L
MKETDLALAILACPLFAALITPCLRVLRLNTLAHVPAVLGFGTAAVLALVLLTKVAGAHDHPSFIANPAIWFSAGHVTVPFSIHVDPISCIMLATVMFVATWIAVFSASYMHGENGYDRYFSIMSLFVFCMGLLVLANNFLVLVAGWEGVGLCSYLLVGYYYFKPSAAAAARKAFLVTRLGDVGLLLGIFLLWQAGGYQTNLDALFANIAANPPQDGTLTTAVLLLFCGAAGKSAQLPLYVWLPDAMEGPTPVSALIHAATMVTAGVYLIARCAPLVVLAPTAAAAIALVGALTAFLAAFYALAQTDLKRILAYSTVSQLGFMFMALGCIGAITPGLAVCAAIFHLFTHAFFKALLFLGSGSVMHAMGNVIDIRKFGGLRKLMPVTHLTFLAGSAALAGLPPLAGFWSKDQILDCLLESSEGDSPNHAVYVVVLALALLTACLTAFYTFRAYFLTFWGEERIPHEAGHHAHESPKMMTTPLVILAVGALVAGLAVEPLTNSFSHFIAEAPSTKIANGLYEKKTGLAPIEHPHINVTVAIIGTGLAMMGMGLAMYIYGKGGPVPVPPAAEPFHALSRNKLYVDEIYNATLVKPMETLATGARQLDAAASGTARLVAFLPRFLGATLRPLQNGLIQFYALGMVLGLAVFLTLAVVRFLR